MTLPIVLDLCGGTGSWSAPYERSGKYEVWIVSLPEWDVRDFAVKMGEFMDTRHVRGVLAAPPCDHFAAVGARYWKEKDADGRTADAIEVVNACVHIVRKTRPKWWALENPKGRISKLCNVGPARLSIQPWEYGDPWTKRTILYGRFTPPKKSPVKPKGMMPALLKSGDAATGKTERSVTPPGFAQAFFEANP